MKVWFEGDTLYYDVEYHGVRPQFIKIPHGVITSINIKGNQVHVERTTANCTIYDIDDPTKTKLIYDEGGELFQ